jgi:hypothetical protein
MSYVRPVVTATCQYDLTGGSEARAYLASILRYKDSIPLTEYSPHSLLVCPGIADQLILQIKDGDFGDIRVPVGCAGFRNVIAYRCRGGSGGWVERR